MFLIFIFVEQLGEIISHIGKASYFPSIITDKEPTTVAESGNTLILISWYAGTHGVIVPGGKYYIKCNTLLDAIKTAFMCFYVLHYKYASPQKCVYGILDRFSEVKTTRVNLGNRARQIVTDHTTSRL